MHNGRRYERLSARAILLAVSLGVALESHGLAAQTAPVQAVVEECRVLIAMDGFTQAIGRCEEAVRLDPKLPEPYYMLGAAHDLLWQQESRTSAAPDAARMREHRRKAAENYKKFLALNRGDTEARLRARLPGLSGLLALYVISGSESPGAEKDEAMVEYANELAKAPTLVKRDLLVLAAVYAHHGRPDLSVGFLTRDLKADPADKETCAFLIQLYNDPALKDDPRTDDRIGNLELCAAQRPGDPQAYLRLATSLWDKAYRDKALTDPQKLAYVERGLGHIDRALALDKDLLEAIVYKNLLLRTKAMSVTDPALQKRLLDEANDLQARSRAMMAAKGIPSSPPPAPPRQLAESVSGVPEVFRVGGVVKTPRKLKDVPPDYPAIAQSARVQGVVILECTIDPQGNVLDAKVLRSIPLLDQAAIDAVKQWVFEPSLYEGVPVTVIMTVTVNFKLS